MKSVLSKYKTGKKIEVNHNLIGGYVQYSDGTKVSEITMTEDEIELNICQFISEYVKLITKRRKTIQDKSDIRQMERMGDMLKIQGSLGL